MVKKLTPRWMLLPSSSSCTSTLLGLLLVLHMKSNALAMVANMAICLLLELQQKRKLWYTFPELTRTGHPFICPPY